MSLKEKIAEFLKTRDEGVLPDEVDDMEREASAEVILEIITTHERAHLSGQELWEVLFGVTEGDVDIPEEALEKAAEHLRNIFIHGQGSVSTNAWFAEDTVHNLDWWLAKKKWPKSLETIPHVLENAKASIEMLLGCRVQSACETVRLVAPEGWYLLEMRHRHDRHQFRDQVVKPLPHEKGPWVVEFQRLADGGRMTSGEGHTLVEAWQNAQKAVLDTYGDDLPKEKAYSYPAPGDRGNGRSENNEGDTLEGVIVPKDDPNAGSAGA